MNNNKNLLAAKKAKNDEFYTRYEDIEKELENYKEQLNNKSIYCNCDDYRFSNFYKYFKDNFKDLNIKKLTATNYDIGQGAYKCEYDGINETITKLQGNGDFKSNECIDVLKQSDIVISNPPFSIFNIYIQTLMEHNKKFLVIGNNNTITYKNIFPYIKDNKLWFGINHINNFIQTDKQTKRFGNINWFTNLEHNKNHPIELTRKYNPEHYPKYDNYNGINVDRIKDIPMDYDGVMGVPITFLSFYNPEQFEIVGWTRHNNLNMDGGFWLGGKSDATLQGKEIYRRILIKNKQIKP